MRMVFGRVDNETLNAMIRQEMDERALAAQVQKHGAGHGRDAVSQAVAPGARRICFVCRARPNPKCG